MRRRDRRLFNTCREENILQERRIILSSNFELFLGEHDTFSISPQDQKLFQQILRNSLFNFSI